MGNHKMVTGDEHDVLVRRLVGLTMTMELAKKMRTDVGLFTMLDTLDDQLHTLISDVRGGLRPPRRE